MDLVHVTRSLLRDAIKMFVAAQEKVCADGGRRGIEFLVELIGRQLLEFA